MKNQKVVVVDDNQEFRNSAEWRLESAGYDVVGFANAKQAYDYFHQTRKNHSQTQNVFQDMCILLDVRMPEMSGLDFHDALHSLGLYPPVIYMTGHGEVPLAVEAMKKGAITFLEKPFDNTTLQAALDSAFDQIHRSHPGSKGDLTGDNANLMATVTQLDENQLAYQQRYAKLTPREREVLQGVVEGKLNKVIADKLDISIKTVEVYRARLVKKLEAKSLPEMVRMVVTERV